MEIDFFKKSLVINQTDVSVKGLVGKASGLSCPPMLALGGEAAVFLY